MDLNANNYSTQELLQIFDINLKAHEYSKIDINLLEHQLNKKIDKLKLVNNDEFDNELIENKTQLIDFFYKCFIKVTNIVKELQQNNVINQDNHFIINHKENLKHEFVNSQYKSGTVNPLSVKTLKKIININTRFRDNYNSTLSSDFTINLPFTLKKVLTMKLINYKLPHTVYTISSKLGSNCFYVNDKLILLTNGSYDSESVIEEINHRMEEYELNVMLELNDITGKMGFHSTNDTLFNLKFDFIEENSDLNCILPNNITKDQLTIGWLLGFRGRYIDKAYKSSASGNGNIKPEYSYTGKHSYESESIYDNVGNTYFLLSINDYQNNHDNIFISPFKYQSLADSNVLAKLSIDCHSKNMIEYPKRIYFGPTDINKLYIKIYDEFGRIIDVNNADLSIELECDILYDL